MKTTSFNNIFILSFFGVCWLLKQKNKKRKITNHLEDIDDKFKNWGWNVYCSLIFYVFFFFLTKQFIDRWIRPNIDRLLELSVKGSVGISSALLGFLFIIDSRISSILKTPLQRLGIKIEQSTDLTEKDKKFLLSKTQEANETFKEDFKRFGLLALPSIIIGLVRTKWNEEAFSYFFVSKFNEHQKKTRWKTISNLLHVWECWNGRYYFPLVFLFFLLVLFVLILLIFWHFARYLFRWG